MAGNLIRGSSQIMPQSIGLPLFDPALSLPDSYLANGANFIKRDGSVSFTGNINLGGNKITGVAPGVAGSDAATMAQVQAYINGLNIHFVRVVAGGNIGTLGGLQTIDDVTLSAGDIAFLVGQTTQAQNGPWVVATGAWTRPADWASGSTQTEGHYFIAEPDGTTYKNTKWFLANTAPPVVDTTNVTFTQDAGSSYSAGTGLALAGTVFSVARGNGIGLDGSNAITVAVDTARMLQSTSSGVGIKDGTAAQLLMANSAGNASYQSMSGDVTISPAGATTVNHTAGSGFLKYTDIVTNETPSGAANGTNTAYTLAATPQNGSLSLYKNGALMKPGAGNDYTISGASITMLQAPLTADQLLASYTK